MVLEIVFDFSQSLMSSAGYIGLFILMALESMIVPVPSEAVMPFAGYLAYRGIFSLILAAAVSTLGSIAGSLISYYAGIYFGRAALLRFGRYFLVGEKELAMTESWFRRWGEKAVLICRFVPVVRHLVSIPAGIGKMNMAKFLTYTFAGALIWNSFLLYLGYSLKDGWMLIYAYSKELDLLVGAVLVIGAGWVLLRRRKMKN